MRHAVLTAIAAGLLSSSALAQPAGDPREPFPAPPGPLMQRYRLEGFEPKLVKAPYLGIATSPAPKSLRHQVDLPDGVGLVVDTVASDSPAAEAGLKQHDLLHKLNDQILVNPQQLAVLVRTFKPGDTVRITAVRAGKPVELSAKLTEKELPPLDELRIGMDPRMLEDRFIFVNPGAGPQAAPPGRPQVGPFDAHGAGIPGLVAENFTVSWDDGHVSMAIKSINGKRTLVARDKAGKVLYDGAIDTEEQQQALPPEVRDRLKKVHVMNGGASHQRPGSDSEKKQPTPPQRKEQRKSDKPDA